MYSIGNLCHEFKLSRSTLLYYDTIGLLTASCRTQGNYRQYSEEDKKRLEQICAFREAGVSLTHIREILDTDGRNESIILKKRFNELNHEIKYLKLQQKLIVEMLKEKNLTDNKMLMDSQTFKSILKSVGLNDETMDYFHVQLEKNSPDFHQLFLEFLGLTEDEINYIRKYSN